MAAIKRLVNLCLLVAARAEFYYNMRPQRTQEPTVPTIPRRIQYLLTLTALLFAMQVVFRGLFWAFLSDLPMAAEQHLLQAFWVGIRFDLRVALLAALCTIPWLIIPRFNAVNYAWLMTTLSRWVGLILLAILCIYVVDAGHYLYLTKRLDASVIRFSSNLKESSLMVWQSYPVIWILLAMTAVWLTTYKLHQMFVLTILQYSPRPQRWWQRSIAVLLFGALLLLLILGRWSLVPLRWNHAYFYGDAEVAALGLNPMVWTYDTAKYTNSQISKTELSAHYPSLQKLLGTNLPSDHHAALDRIYTPVAPVVSEDATPNVVIVFLESLGNSHIGAYGNPLQPTPNIDALIKQSRWYPHFNVPARSTAKSVFTSITGIPDVSAIRTATRNPYITHQRSIFNHFDDYKKYYMLGGSAGWANMSATVHNSITGIKLFEEKAWQSPIEDVWGITDGDLFKESTQILSKAPKPFMAYIQSAANHSPHTIPEHVPGFVEKTASEQELQQGLFINQDQYNAVRLIDHNVGYLIEQFQQAKLYENSIFIFFADHQASGKSVNFLPQYIFDYNIGELPVPLIIHSPQYIKPEIDPTYGSLPDLLPTIAGLFERPFLNTTLGRDLAWAKGKELPAYGYEQSERKSVTFNGKVIASVNHITGLTRASRINDQGQAEDIDTNHHDAKVMIDYAKAYYTASQYLLQANVKQP